MLILILQVFAFVFLVIAALGVALPRLNFGWMGLALLVLTYILQRGVTH